MFTRNKAAYYLKAATGVFILFVLLRWTWLVFSKDAVSYLYYFLNSSGRDINFEYKGQSYIHISFTLLRIFLAATTLFTGFRLYRALKYDKTLIIPAETKIFHTVADTLNNNRTYWRNLDTTIKIPMYLLVALLLTVLLYSLFTSPNHYDESYSYMYFSGRGLLADVTFYPVPNNHIFYNIIATFFVWLPIDPIIAIRLPNVLISFISVYYFFKCASLLTNERAGVITTAIFTFSYPFIMYSMLARGYGFFILFSIFLLYCFICIVNNTGTLKRYLSIYAITSVLGLYTIPTFTYMLLPTSAALFIFCLFRNSQYNIAALVKAHVAIVFFTLLLYAPLFIVNGLDVFQKAMERGVAPIQDSFTYAHVVKHLQDTWGYMLTGNNLTPFALPVIVLAILINAYKKSAGSRYTAWLLVVLLCSPVFILLVQRSIPFSRTWSHILIPLALGAGCVIFLLSKYFNGINRYVKMGVTIVAIFVYGIWQSLNTRQMYQALHRVDYTVRDYNKVLQNKLPAIDTIQHTNDFSFYLAEGIQCETMRRGYKVKTKIWEGTDSLNDELIVTTAQSDFTAPVNYELLPLDNSYFRVYIRKDL